MLSICVRTSALCSEQVDEHIVMLTLASCAKGGFLRFRVEIVNEKHSFIRPL
jgi:hypothetical protein